MDMTIAQTILDQLGGQRFVAMTGARNYVAAENFLQFSIPKSNGINKVRVTLDPWDTYTVTFYELRRGQMAREVDSIGDVYADNLQHVFTARTGLDTRI